MRRGRGGERDIGSGGWERREARKRNCACDSVCVTWAHGGHPASTTRQGRPRDFLCLTRLRHFADRDDVRHRAFGQKCP